MYVFSLITWFFLTCSYTTPTITIFVSLLFDKAVSMVKHIMEIVEGNTEFIKAGQTPGSWRVSLNIWGSFICTLLAKLGPWGWLIMMRLVWKTARRIIIALFGTARSGMRRVVTPWGSVVGDAHHWRDQPFYAIPKQLQWQFLESLGEDRFFMQLGALQIKDMHRNRMVALSLYTMTTTSRAHGTCIEYHNLLCFWINKKCILGSQFMSNYLLNTE